MAQLIRETHPLEAMEPVLFPPAWWLEKTSTDPQLARDELIYHARELRRVQTENSKVRKQRDGLERNAERLYNRLEAIALERDQEYAQGRSTKRDHKDAQDTLQALEKLQLRLEQRLQEAQLARDKANLKAQALRHQVRKLETKLRATKRGVNGADAVSAMKKLALHHAVGKRLAAATHPDRVPIELNDSASELFRFLQKIREQSRPS